MIANVLPVSPRVALSHPVAAHGVLVLCGGLIARLAANAPSLPTGLAPLQRLTKTMADASLLEPGHRARITGRGELADLTETVNVMLSRLEPSGQ
ncbi:HAMP domain-containing protein [Streptomyces sp. CC210A]|uniref:HAMP domain-containing protein n=1 Tax=Streptomyces sp. CC210A TaxID=2898184 RepID=UPI001F20E504|nr:HAMP domain-containing protein [Streptomyces sp. CC210A]